MIRKEIEKLFGVLQARFRILPQESAYSNIKDIFDLSEACAMLHKVLVRMEQKGVYERAGSSHEETELLVSTLYIDDIVSRFENDVFSSHGGGSDSGETDISCSEDRITHNNDN